MCVSLLRTCRIYSHKSSVHRSLGRPMRRGGVYLGMEFGSHRNAVVIQLSSGIDIILCAHFHFRLRCMVTQSSNLSCFILASASWVHLFIQSTHGSASSALSFGFSSGCVSNVGGLLFTSSSLSSSVVLVAGGVGSASSSLRLLLVVVACVGGWFAVGWCCWWWLVGGWWCWWVVMGAVVAGGMLAGVDVAVVGVLWVCDVVYSVWCRRLGKCKIMRNICRCVFLKRFSSSVVSVHVSVPYRTVGVIVPWNSLSRSERLYRCPVSSCFSVKNFFQATEILISTPTLCMSVNVSLRPRYLV